MITWRVDRAQLDQSFAQDIDDTLGPMPDHFVATEGFRTFDYQASLYKKYLQGGPRAAPPGKSAHEKRFAVDVTLVRADGKSADWDYTGEEWRALVAVIHAHPRLHSGDTDHIERLHWQTLTPTPRASFQNG